jgi:hypothetical protein
MAVRMELMRSKKYLEAPSGLEPLHKGFADLPLSHLGTAPFIYGISLYSMGRRRARFGSEMKILSARTFRGEFSLICIPLQVSCSHWPTSQRRIPDTPHNAPGHSEFPLIAVFGNLDLASKCPINRCRITQHKGHPDQGNNRHYA